MAIVNHAKREINAKIVYFGHEGAGKATAMRYVYDRIKPSLRGEFKIVPAGGSDLVFFDFRPFEQTLSGGYRLCLHVYTLHGKVINPAAWKMTLKGTDGVVIIGDAAPGMLAAMQQSILQLKELLSGYGMALDSLPAVLQLNKADLCGNPAAGHVEQIAASLGIGGTAGFFSAALTGQGVLEALTGLSRQVIERISQRDDLKPVCGFALEPGGTNGMESNAGKAEPLPVVGTPEPAPLELGTEVITEAQPESHAPVAGGAAAGDIRIAVAATEIRYEEGLVRIPLDIVAGATTKRLVVTVAAELQ